MAIRYRYSEWDGTQDIPALDAGEVLEALSDDLMNFGDLQHALRNLMQRGMRTPQGGRMQGLRDLLQQLRQRRRQRLDQFDLGGVMEDLRRQLDEILDLERRTLDDRLGRSPQQPGPQQPGPQQPGPQQPRGG
ncbi:MAG: VWA domain-containing protein, partial [Chloroflexi bacterium]|nr:VWA domain-containing protein [Chloroflexota bacterium]